MVTPLISSQAQAVQSNTSPIYDVDTLISEAGNTVTIDTVVATASSPPGGFYILIKHHQLPKA
jgi:uncharacterized protein YlxW (UPF0749 family)